MSYPQPREGITGTARGADDLLSLEASALAARKVIIGMTAVLQRVTLVGDPAPVTKRVYERMKNPQPGDLVLETSTMYRESEHWYTRLGILLAHRTEWFETDAEWEQQVAAERAAHDQFLRGPYGRPGDADIPFEPDERMTDHAWYIQYGPQADDVFRWVNCSFVAIPADPETGAFPAGERDGSQVMFTRDSILGSLADSGFSLKTP